MFLMIMFDIEDSTSEHAVHHRHAPLPLPVGLRKQTFKKQYRDGVLPAAVDLFLTREHGEHWTEYRDTAIEKVGWLERAVAVKKFRNESGTFPSRTAEAKNERVIAHWFASTVSRYKNGTLEPERQQWFDEHVPDWLAGRADQWMVRQGNALRRGDLTESRASWMNENVEGWSTRSLKGDTPIPANLLQ